MMAGYCKDPWTQCISPVKLIIGKIEAKPVLCPGPLPEILFEQEPSHIVMINRILVFTGSPLESLHDIRPKILEPPGKFPDIMQRKKVGYDIKCPVFFSIIVWLQSRRNDFFTEERILHEQGSADRSDIQTMIHEKVIL